MYIHNNVLLLSQILLHIFRQYTRLMRRCAFLLRTIDKPPKRSLRLWRRPPPDPADDPVLGIPLLREYINSLTADDIMCCLLLFAKMDHGGKYYTACVGRLDIDIRAKPPRRGGPPWNRTFVGAPDQRVPWRRFRNTVVRSQGHTWTVKHATINYMREMPMHRRGENCRLGIHRCRWNTIRRKIPESATAHGIEPEIRG